MIEYNSKLCEHNKTTKKGEKIKMKNKKILIVILLVALLTLNFAKNFISNSSIKIGEIDFWNFQNDSEY